LTENATDPVGYGAPLRLDDRHACSIPSVPPLSVSCSDVVGVDPLSKTVCGELLALSLTFRVAVYTLPLGGEVDCTLIVHCALAAKLPPQVLLGEEK